MAEQWTDLLDPTPEQLAAALPVAVDREVAEALEKPRLDRPRIETFGDHVFGVLVAMPPVGEERRVVRQPVAFVATPEAVVLVRRTPPDGPPYDSSALDASGDQAPPGVLVQRLADDIADTFLDLLDATYAEIDTLEDDIDDVRPSEIRLRLSDLRHEILHRRRIVSATRAVARRVLDGRVDVGGRELFPEEVEHAFGDTYDTLVRVTEDLDVARDLLAGVRDHLQAKVAESQNEVGKKLTVIASLVLVPSLVVGFFGQNFEGEFQKGWWTLGVSTGIILASTLVQVALFRWRRWI